MVWVRGRSSIPEAEVKATVCLWEVERASMARQEAG